MEHEKPKHSFTIDNMRPDSNGRGHVFAFLQGIPTCGKVWGPLIESLDSEVSCIVPVTLGVGKHSSVNLDSIRTCLDNSLERAGDNMLVLVMQGDGLLWGLDYASRCPERVAGIVFYEGYLSPFKKMLTESLMLQELKEVLNCGQDSRKQLDSPLFYQWIQSGVFKTISDAELMDYCYLLDDKETLSQLNKIVRMLYQCNQLPEVATLIEMNRQYLINTDIPKLLFFGVPGYMTSMDTVTWCYDNLKHIEVVDVGESLHFTHIDRPKLLAEEILRWYRQALIEHV